MSTNGDEQDERQIVLETIRGALSDRNVRDWRIEHYGRFITTDWGDTYLIHDDGSLAQVDKIPWPPGYRFRI